MNYVARMGELAAQGARRAAFAVDGTEVTFAETADRVRAAALRLSQAGVGVDTVVALSVADDLSHMILALALLGLGARQVNTATHESADTRDQLARRVEARIQIADRPEARIAGLHQIDIPTGPGGAEADRLPWEALPGGGSAFFSTSGTTGRMSIICMQETDLVLQACRGLNQPQDRFLKAASVEFGHVKRNRLFAFWVGACNVLPSRTDRPLRDYLISERVTVADVSRIHLNGLLATGAGGNTGLPSGLVLRSEGSAVPGDLRRRIMQELTPAFHVRFAATECGAIAIAQPEDHAVEGAVGRPLPDVVVRIAGPEGEELPRGEVGELCLKVPGMVQTYVDDPGKSAQRFRDGWFMPGDMARILPDGRLALAGRKDDMINLHGIKIFPVEVEQILARHPDVTGVAVFPLPSRVHGQIPVAAIELRPAAWDSRDRIVSDLMQATRQALGIRAPRRILAFASLPRNPMGKVLVRDLAPHFQARPAAAD